MSTRASYRPYGATPEENAKITAVRGQVAHVDRLRVENASGGNSTRLRGVLREGLAWIPVFPGLTPRVIICRRFAAQRLQPQCAKGQQIIA